MKTMKNVCSAFCILIGLVGCGEEKSSNKSTNTSTKTSTESLIESNLALWKSSDIKNYMFTYDASLNDCPQADPALSRVITVENSVVVSVYVPDRGVTIDVGNYPTIDGVFSLMADAAASNTMVFSRNPRDTDSPPEFNQQYGFPVAFFIDLSEGECDGTVYSIKGFQ
ncbi:DUF6174 domain-containing protein [Marinomonas balearica]|uniref:Lipoprotein n=1 Tax=Marinomonas balearica TaxID=491947 RepID=A0A4R6MIL4_9GAMM|nr:DUF6174 domain-containing protein [Marinomonas balearica]TDP01842.1 hypothetical protein DFP79_0016 [Marinomonas balearica]